MATLTSRLSQALYTYGTGAVADFPDLSLIIVSPDIDNGWGLDNNNTMPKVKITDTRLAAAFGVEYFVQPPLGNLVADPDQPEIRYAVKSHRFPDVLWCNNCKGLFCIYEDLKLIADATIPIGQKPDSTRTGYSCPVCGDNRILVPSRFVIATEDGHLDDFPWDWFVHRNSENKELRRFNRFSPDNNQSCYNRSDRRNLRLVSHGPSLSDLYVECTVCSASESLGTIFDQEKTFISAHDNYLWFTRNRLAVPWKNMVIEREGNRVTGYSYWRENIYAVTEPAILEAARSTHGSEWNRIRAKYPRTLQRGAGNVYFPVTFKGISIPDNINDGNTVNAVPQNFIVLLNNILAQHTDLAEFGSDSEKVNFLKELQDNTLHVIFGRFGPFTVNMIRHYLNQLYPSATAGIEELSGKKTRFRKEEFDFFNDGNQTVPEDFWYKSRIYTGDETGDIAAFTDNIVILDKLRSVQILKGFTRVRPLAFEELIFIQNSSEIQERYRNEYARIRDVRINDGRHVRNQNAEVTPWLPGIEVKGEGFFLKFNDAILKNWERKEGVSCRAGILRKNYRDSLISFGSLPEDADDEFINARYILLHTVSHILIDALVNDSGYNAASLSEIIYCSKATDNFSMNGILIYTSSSDSEGTLGGLAEQGKPENLNRIFRKAVDKARWCSSDPLCIETEQGQGFLGVNLAACHSCCMLPETSCENINKFLDRAMMVGTLSDPDIGFFRFVEYI